MLDFDCCCDLPSFFLFFFFSSINQLYTGVIFSGKCSWPGALPLFVTIMLNYVDYVNFEGSKVHLVNELIMK